MRFIADLQIHSKYSRATSKDMVPEELDRWADDKGILVMGTGDFTHPGWIKELKEKLEPAEPGLFKLKEKYKEKTLKGTFAQTRFMLTAEISNIYRRGGKTRRVHNLIFAPNFETVEAINAKLGWIGNLASDGRPILGLDSEEALKIVLGSNENCLFIPAHIWTPWFSVFGSMSGFDSLEECFGEHTKYIYAVETGLSSDPQMNWRLSKLDAVSIVSNSDSHSLRRIGREANVFDTELSYAGIVDAIKSGIPRESLHASQAGVSSPRTSAFLMTLEFFPEEGKYHFDGHRTCGIVYAPQESKQRKNTCPACGKPLTIGVMNRVEQLADRPQAYRNSRRIPFKNLVPLDEIVAESLGLGTSSKAVKLEYESLVKTFNSELSVLLDVPIPDLLSSARPKIAEAIGRVREGRLRIMPGYDGEYGKVKIFDEDEKESAAGQHTLF